MSSKDKGHWEPRQSCWDGLWRVAHTVYPHHALELTGDRRGHVLRWAVECDAAEYAARLNSGELSAWPDLVALGDEVSA